MGRQQNRVSNSSTSRQDQSGYEPRSRENVAPVASNNSFGSGNRRVEQQLLIDPSDRQTAAYNAIKYDKISINERTILTATSTRDEALQLISNLKSAFHTYHHQEIIHTSYVPILVDRLQLHYRYDKAKRDECDHWRDWSKAVFTQHLKTIWPQTEDVADRTFLDAVRDLPLPVRFREHRGRAENTH